MKFVKVIATALVLGALTVPAMAQEEEKSMLPGSFSGNIALANDYVFRGVSQTLNNATVQGGLDWDSGMGIYLGTWASNVDFGAGDGGMELDFYGGYKGTIGENFSYDIGAIGYLYPGTVGADVWEAKLVVGYDFGIAALSASFYYTPDFLNLGPEGYYYNAGISIPVVENLTLSGAIGHQDAGAVYDATDYNIGASYAFEWFTLDVRWSDTNLSAASCTIANAKGPHTTCDGRVVAKVSRVF